MPPRQTIAEIGPADQRVLTEARTRTERINRSQRGQPAEIPFGAFKHRKPKLVPGVGRHEKCPPGDIEN